MRREGSTLRMAVCNPSISIIFDDIFTTLTPTIQVCIVAAGEKPKITTGRIVKGKKTHWLYAEVRAFGSCFGGCLYRACGWDWA